MTLDIMPLYILTLGLMILRIMTLSIMTSSITDVIVVIDKSIERHILTVTFFTVMLIDCMLNVI
jgi:hypothetical protein